MKFVSLKSCDTCRKASKWLDENGFSYETLDVKKDGVSETDLKRYVDTAGLAKIVNKASTTWRSLSETDKANLSEATAVALLKDNPSLMKRPVFDFGDKVIVGFKAEQQNALLDLKA
jgi:arsenate reductase